jgi:lipopolysaccharide transport system permease protein
MKSFSVTFGLGAIYKNGDLLRSLVKREIQSKYRATTLGLIWVVVYPLMMLGVYTFVFGGVFGARWGNQGDLGYFVPMLYCGLIVHAIFAETLSKSPGLIVNNPNYVKKVVFPLELLPVGSLLSALFNAATGFTLLIIFAAAVQHIVHWTIVFIPLVLLPLILYTIGFAWLLAALGVFFRDIEQFIGVLMTMLLFLSPVFYSASSAPLLAQKLLMFNPIAYPIEEMRNVILLGQTLQWKSWLLNLTISFGAAWFGLWVFEKTRPAFADVI